MDKSDIGAIIYFIGIVLLVVGVLTFVGLSPYFEAKAFNECTGGNATYMTALFTQLRVEKCNK